MDEQGVGKIKNEMQTYFPFRKMAFVLLIVIVSIATNDIRLRYDNFIQSNYWFQLVIVGTLTYMAFWQGDGGDKTTLFTRLLATLLVLLAFYVIAAPKEEEPSKEKSIYDDIFG